MYICQSHSPSSSHSPLSFLGVSMHLSSTSLSLSLLFRQAPLYHFSPSYTVGRNVDWWSHYGEQHAGSLKKLKTELPYDPAILLLGHKPGRNCNSKTYMHSNIHCSTVYNSQDMEATQTCLSRRMDKIDMTHIYNRMLLNHNMGGNSVIFRNMGGPRDNPTQWSKSDRER